MVGATGVAAQPHDALDIVWNVKVDPERPGLRHMLRVRYVSLLTIHGLDLSLLVALVGTAVLFVIGN